MRDLMKSRESINQTKKSTHVKDSVHNISIVHLPEPKFENDVTVYEALKSRKTTRSIKDTELSLQTLSNLLWSANGINRENGPFGIPGKTAGSASNSQEIDIYVVLKDGIYLYESIDRKLTPVLEGDYRTLVISPEQIADAKQAPVHLVYVADIDKFSKAGYQEPGLYTPEVQQSYYYVDTGLIAQNVYLYAAAEGLAAWFHNCNRNALTERINLQSNQKVLFGQTIGYPQED